MSAGTYVLFSLFRLITWNLHYRNILLTGQVSARIYRNDPFHNTYNLEQNYPNPFNPITTISYSPVKAQNVTIRVYDILGREVATLFKGWQSSGTHRIQFNASHLFTFGQRSLLLPDADQRICTDP